jgi:hypothetical protein
MKKYIIFFLLLFSFNCFTQTNIKRETLIKRITKNEWRYDFSKQDDENYEVPPEFFNKFYYLLDFYIAEEYANERIKNKSPWLHSFRKSSMLYEIELFGNEKGSPEHIAIDSDSINADGYLYECKISVNNAMDKTKGGTMYSFYIDELTKKKLVISGWKGESRTVKHHFFNRKLYGPFLFKLFYG